MNDAADGASLAKLAELLRHPEDLDKIGSLKAEFTRKKAAVDAQLRHGLEEQLKITQAGMSSISEGQRTVNAIKDEMMTIDRLCAEAQQMIRDFPHINLVAQTHRNFEAVQKMKKDIDGFEQQLGELEMLLDEDEQDPENQPNLLQVHYGLSKLRNIRDAAMDQIKNSEDETLSLELVNNLQLDSGATLQDYFDRLDRVIELFDEHVGLACMNLIPLVQTGNNGMVVRLALIIEEEEKVDKKVQALQDAQREYKELASRFKSIATGPKELRGYKEKFLKAIELAAQSKIEEANEAFMEDPDRLEKSVRWYFNDLNTVKLGMVNLMPRKWRVFKTYVSIYHKLMHDWLVGHIDDPDLKPIEMLAIVQWEEKYYKKMNKLGVPEEDLTPHLLDNRGAELVREYRQLIIKAVEEWMSRMSQTDKSEFLTRSENSLDTDINGCFRTKTLGDMWSMLREQLAVAGNSNRHDVAEGVIDAMFKALSSRQRLWEELVDIELDKYVQGVGDVDGLQPLQDWLVAIANDQIACIDDGEDEAQTGGSYLSRFSRDALPLASPQYSAAAAQQIDLLRDGYVDLGTHCLTVFVRLIFDVDFRTILPEFFTPTWYSQKRVGQIVSTFQDYLNDYDSVLHPSLRDVLVEELADELLSRYLAAVRNKGAKFRRTDPYVEKIRDDVLAVFDFFGQFETVGPDIRQKWRVVEKFVQLLDADKHAVAEVFAQFKMEYWDVNVGWVEAVLRARDDSDRSMIREVKARAGQVEVERGVETIMSKVK
ncbi:Exocyst complex component sec6 [Lasiodiplodia hormozganensis]|uniref:Exocyst complex component sec6 n=1 Tax=Lasiodiplodia hormozganensis TaxID=869390 RepID=A0AA39Z091_9PEZI|nr:Exocyst complex component sec6 [Lasiodiplodia hormozganensis]